MFDIEVAVVLLSIDLSGEKIPHYMMVYANGQWQLPTTFMEASESSFDAAARLVETLIEHKVRRGNAGWVELSQCGLYDKPERLFEGERQITVSYGGMIPKGLIKLRPQPVHQLSWLSAQDLLKAEQERKMFMDHLQIIAGVGRQL